MRTVIYSSSDLTPQLLEEVAEPGRKRNAADAEWLSMATADPAYFLKDLHAE